MLRVRALPGAPIRCLHLSGDSAACVADTCTAQHGRMESPVSDGIEVLKILREKHSQAELPVIMATAKSDSEDMVEALDVVRFDVAVDEAGGMGLG